ncbi:MGMT family protein [archaeon]|nr:MAG: MGMT family protein [archaeon]
MVKFEEKVWQLLKRIPKGKVTTYKIIARKLNARAYRAVGRACARNPNAPRVPCHRVVMSSGKLGGYTADGSKASLLKKEGVIIRNGKVDLVKYLYDF